MRAISHTRAAGCKPRDEVPPTAPVHSPAGTTRSCFRPARKLLSFPERFDPEEEIMSLRTLAALSTVFVLFGGPLAGSAWAEPLPRATPEQVGLSSERLGHVSHVLREEILKGKLPGAVALV